jgi:DHA2 family multidrug resistance protein
MKERSFAVAIILMFMLGFILYGSTVLLPLFLQTLMGYSATTSGMVLSPGGIVTMMTMPLVGFLLTKMDARRLVGLGMAILAVSLFRMGRFNLAIDYRTAMMSRVIQSAGLAFLFIPINTVAYTFVAHQKRNQASGLINFARNIGGSVGIAFCATMLSRAAQKHQSVLSAHVTATSPAFQAALGRMTETLHWAGQPLGRAHAMAQGMFYGELVRQANMLAYADVFRLMGFVSLAAMALVFLLKKNRPAKSPAVIH